MLVSASWRHVDLTQHPCSYSAWPTTIFPLPPILGSADSLVVQLNIACPETGAQKAFAIEDEKKL